MDLKIACSVLLIAFISVVFSHWQYNKILGQGLEKDLAEAGHKVSRFQPEKKYFLNFFPQYSRDVNLTGRTNDMADAMRDLFKYNDVRGRFIKDSNNIKNILDNNKIGFIYFSMDSYLNSSTLPVQQRDDILKVFSKLYINVLWKFDGVNLPGKPDNVFISQWFPQDIILAHPNIKLFISHGGLSSTTEAIRNGVPILGIPIFFDQYLNMKVVNRAGRGLTVPYHGLNDMTFSIAANEILSNRKFRELAKPEFQYLDQPLTPLQTAVFWIEYKFRRMAFAFGWI